MPDELYAQYRQLSHQELYDRLKSGDPAQVEALVTAWKSIETTASGLAASLSADLDRLMQTWDSAAGWEFHYRVSLIAAYAQMLAEEFASIHNGLSAMSGALADAKGEAEPPEAIPPPPKTPGEVAAATLLGGTGTLISGVVGNALGHQPDPAAQRRAHERMVNVVADLAGEYRVAEYGTWPPSVPTAPAELPARHPTAPASATTQPTTGGGGTRPSTSPSTNVGPVSDHGRDHRDHRRGHDTRHDGMFPGPTAPAQPTAPAVVGGAGTGLIGVTAPVAATGLSTQDNERPAVVGDLTAETAAGSPRGLTGVTSQGVTTGVIGGVGDTTTTTPGGQHAAATTAAGGSPSGGGHGHAPGHSSGGHSTGGHVVGGGESDNRGQPSTMPPPTTTPTGLAAAGPVSAAQPAHTTPGVMANPVVEEQRRWLTASNVVWRGDEDASSPAVLGPPEPDELYE